MVSAAAPALAWNGTGHELVAQVAWDQLSPADRHAAIGLLRAHPRFEKDLMQDLNPGENPNEHAFRVAATWPDLVKSPVNPLERTEDHKPWHYVDYPYDRDGQHGPMPAEAWDGHAVPTDLLQAMQMVTAQLRDPATPLHAVSLFSKTYPTGDQGGNLIHVRTLDSPDTNLHSVWDGIEGMSYQPLVLHNIAARIEREHPRPTELAALAKTDPKAWAQESERLAEDVVYLNGKLVGVTRDQAADNPDGVPPVPAGYERQAHKLADAQIAVAGYRLADLLHELLAAQPATAPTTRPAVP
jgi:hypothetical protein